jgi:hypothetical protein
VSFPTTRRYPRTLAEAWPREHANPIEHYTPPAPAALRAAVCVGAFVVIGLLIGASL